MRTLWLHSKFGQVKHVRPRLVLKRTQHTRKTLSWFWKSLHACSSRFKDDFAPWKVHYNPRMLLQLFLLNKQKQCYIRIWCVIHCKYFEFFYIYMNLYAYIISSCKTAEILHKIVICMRKNKISRLQCM